MSTFQQLCPACGRLLELPLAAIGNQGQCPACDAVFIAKAPATTATEASTNPDHAFSQPTRPAEQTLPESVGSFLPPDHPPEQIHSVSLDAVWLSAWRLFSERFGVMVLMAVIVNVVYLVGMVATQATAGETLFALPTRDGWIAIVVSTLANQYLNLGFAQASLAIARREKEILGRLFPSIVTFGRYLIGIMIAMAAAIAIGGLVAAIGYGIGYAAGGEQVAQIGLVVGAFAGLLTLLAIYLVYWAYSLMASEQCFTMSTWIRVGSQLTLTNLVTVLLLYVVTSVLSIAGFLAFGIGVLFTTPLSWLLFTVAYLKMTGQPFYDPPAKEYSSLLLDHP